MAKEQGKIARRYARALFELCPPNELEQMRASLQAFSAVWAEQGTLRTALANPVVTQSDRATVLLQVAQKIGLTDTRFKNFILLLVENDRVDIVPEVSQVFSTMLDQLRKVLALDVVSAFELPEGERQAVQERIRTEFGALATISWNVDKEILGGLLIKSGDRLLDSTVRGSLEKIRAALVA